MSVLELPATGVAKVVSGLYGAVAERFPEIRLHGIHRRRLASRLPSGVQDKWIGRYMGPGLWRRLAVPIAARHPGNDVIHFPWNGGVPKLSPGVRVVTTMHDVLPLTIPGYFASGEAKERYRRLRQSDIDRSTLVVTDSEFSKQEIMRHLRVRREPVVIPCATSIADFAEAGGAAEKRYFLYVGGLDPRKSVDSLLRVFSSLFAGGNISSTLVVTGSRRHAPPALLSLLDEGLRRGCVEYAGYVDDRALARLYTGALALVYPSRYEGFGMPPLEAMTIGCPVITSRMTSIPEVCGDAALYIDPWSERGLAEALQRFEHDTDLQERLRREGRIRAASFSWGKAAAAFVRALRECHADMT